MPHTCEDCGEEFKTLSRLRLHDCREDESTASQDMFEERKADLEKQERETERRVRRAASEDLTDAIERAQQGDEMAIYQTLAQYERQLSDEWARENGGTTKVSIASSSGQQSRGSKRLSSERDGRSSSTSSTHTGPKPRTTSTRIPNTRRSAARSEVISRSTHTSATCS